LAFLLGLGDALGFAMAFRGVAVLCVAVEFFVAFAIALSAEN
jgi:hypothetical protein